MNNNLCFDGKLAVKIGLREAILISTLDDVITKDGKLIDNELWVRVSISELCEMMPYCSEIGMKKIVAKVRGNGYIDTTRQYNNEPLDRTLWYRLTERGYSAITIRRYTKDTIDKKVHTPVGLPPYTQPVAAMGD